MDHEGVFLAFLANVSCMISRASGGFAPWTPISAPPWNCWGAESAPSRPQLQGTMIVGHCMSCLRHKIHTSCDLQATDSWKSISILMGKLRGKWVEIIKTSENTQGKWCWKFCTNSDWLFLISCYLKPFLKECRWESHFLRLIVNLISEKLGICIHVPGPVSRDRRILVMEMEVGKAVYPAYNILPIFWHRSCITNSLL